MNRVAALAVAVVALLVGDVVGLVVVLDDGDGAAAAPRRWDPRVAEVARFVASERGLRFKHPVEVEFLDGDDYAQAATDEGDTAPGDAEAEDELAGVLRAIGLIPRDADLTDAGEEFISEGTLAFYDFEQERVVVRGTKVNVDIRVTLAHELTHVLHDQHFNLDREFDTDGEDTAFHALIEGDAGRVERAYADQLTGTDRRAYEESESGRGEEGVEFDSVPPALAQLFAAPYALGGPFVDLIVEARGTSGLDEAIRRPPSSEEALFDGFTFLDGQKVKQVAEPKLADGEKRIDDGDFGSVTWFVMLASHVDDRTALQAVDGWGGDAYVAYKADGKTCLRARFVGDTPADSDEMAAALDKWGAAFATGTVVVGRAGDAVEFRSCDSGGDVPAPAAGLESALVVPSARTTFAAELLKQRVPAAIARCAAAKVVAAYTTEQLASDELAPAAPDPATVGRQAGQECLREQGRRG